MYLLVYGSKMSLRSRKQLPKCATCYIYLVTRSGILSSPHTRPTVNHRAIHTKPAQADLLCQPQDFIRLSIGLEDIEDILWDLDEALNA